MKLQDQIIFGVCAFFMVINSAHSLKCYTCSSDAIGGDFCKDPFKREMLTTEQRAWSEKDCDLIASSGQHSPLHSVRNVCKKLVQEVNGREVIQRQCFRQDLHESSDHCAHDETPAYIRTKYCQTCDTDFCNSAGIFTPVLSLVIMSALLAKLFVL